jgi:predicted O-linked N-acetylglucosamine transferase (SPINDLY family)/2-polyprenyl-3-methyl-5-hydroxy-6-metoxy-1,4-benzoquinol methylase
MSDDHAIDLQHELTALVALFEQGRHADALPRARRVTERFPDFGVGWKILGAVLHQLGRNAEGAGPLQRAVELAPQDPHAYYCLGNTLGALARHRDAEACYRRAIALHPGFAEAYSNLGATLHDLRRLDEAEAAYRDALRLNPNIAETYKNLADTLRDQGRLVDARDCCRRALELNPDYADAHQALANLSAYLSDFVPVVEESDTALRLSPDNAMLWEQRLYTLSYHPDLSAARIFDEFVRWGNRFPDPVTDFSSHDRTPGRRLRIGFVSPDFRRHTSRFYFWSMFANHDRAVVEMFAYANVLNEDEATARFKTVFDHWRNIRGVADRDAAQMIRDDRIDILVDGCNHMLGDRLGVFALKPAPVQVTWLGAAWTTGLKAIDYVLFDPHIAPEGTLARESIVRLPRCFIAFEPEKAPPVAMTPALKNGAITFGYTGRSERLNHHTFRVWSEILRRIPRSRLILDYRCFADPRTQEHYRQLLRRHGVEPDRVTMRQSADILAGLSDIDVLLDCFPHSGGTMLLDALWMGVPCLTLAGRPPLGRIGTTFLINMGLPEWVATTHDDYIDKAVCLTRDIEALAELRAGMRERMRYSPIMDGKGFARAVEAAYRAMYEKWAGGRPDSSRQDAKQHLSPSARAQAVAYFNEAIDFRQQDRLEEAATFYRKALEIDPDFAEASYNLGNVLAALGHFDAATRHFRDAARRLNNPLVHNNLGLASHELKRFDAAADSFRTALRIDPGYADAHYNLGNTLTAAHRPDDARASFERALQLDPNFAEALNSLGALLYHQGHTQAALELALRSLRVGASRQAKALFVACVRDTRFTKANADLRALLIRALVEPWGRPRDLAHAVINVIELDSRREAALSDPLLHTLLEATPVCDVALERLLTRTREQLLHSAAADPRRGDASGLLCALAHQCFINEYVFTVTDDEQRSVDALRGTVTAALASGAPIAERALATLATYVPLHSIANSGRLAERAWSDTIARIVARHVTEPAEEQRLRATIPRLTTISDAVSGRVREQYEANPYPRWIRSAHLGEPKALEDFLREKFPVAQIEAPQCTDRCEILVAGCGTGQHPIATAQRIRGAQVLAVDLSLTSLAYARRKARESGNDAIEFAQADLLELPSIGRTFDVIESVGVLHHLADPWTGWRALLSMLRPGGFMKLGFYSEFARRDVVRIRNYIADRRIGSTAQEIRRCRQELIRLGDSGQFGAILASPDFYSVSACRDLLFHVQEHLVTLTRIGTFLGEQRLRFLGFELDARVLRDYSVRFPDDAAATNLDHWNEFEYVRPETFGNMYQFWVQRPR